MKSRFTPDDCWLIFVTLLGYPTLNIITWGLITWWEGLLGSPVAMLFLVVLFPVTAILIMLAVPNLYGCQFSTSVMFLFALSVCCLGLFNLWVILSMWAAV